MSIATSGYEATVQTDFGNIGLFILYDQSITQDYMLTQKLDNFFYDLSRKINQQGSFSVSGMQMHIRVSRLDPITEDQFWQDVGVVMNRGCEASGYLMCFAAVVSQQQIQPGLNILLMQVFAIGGTDDTTNRIIPYKYLFGICVNQNLLDDYME